MKTTIATAWILSACQFAAGRKNNRVGRKAEKMMQRHYRKGWYRLTL